MNEPGFPRYPPPPPSHQHHHLNPTAQEFFPATSFSSLTHQIYYPYPPSIYAQPHFPPPPGTYVTEPPPVIPPTSPSAPSRTLLLSMVPASVSESTVRRDLEIFGDVRAVQMERRRQGLVTVHFYDIRDSQTALVAIQQQHMQQQLRIGQHYDAVVFNNNSHVGFIPPPVPPPARGLISGRVVWAQFDCPVTAGLPDGNNQGTLVIFNLDTRVSANYLQEIFEAFGPVKELRETPKKRHQRFVEFYDVRNAATAISEMNGKEIYGRAITIDYSRPGGHQSKKSNNGPPNNGTGSSKFCPPLSRNSARFSVRSLPVASPSTPPLFRKPYGRVPRSGSDGSKSSSSNGSSILGSVAKLCIYDQECSNVGGSKRKCVKKGFDFGGGNSKGGGIRPWKGGASGGGRNGNEYDPRFLINEDAIMESNCRDLRTTVMIKNIPNKYSQKLLLNMLDNHCIHCNEQIADGEDDHPLSSYDFVYLPIDFINKCNVGYGFVNMTSPEATLRLYKAFHHQNWEVFNSKKICEVTYARLQGLEALREHFKNSKFPGDTEEYMPVVFTPPRDGRRLTDPSPIFGCQAADLSLSLSPPSTAGSSRGNQSIEEVHDDGDEDRDRLG